MIDSLVEPGVSVAVATAEDYVGALQPIEEEQIAGAVRTRRREFAAGRSCARRALAALGGPAEAIPHGADRAPQWPAGFTGSITHTAGYCAAAVARSAEYLGIGIDAERRVAMDPRVVTLITTERERAAGFDVQGVEVPLLWFSAKESFFKAWSAAGGRWLDYREGEVSVDPLAGSFTVAVPSGERRGVVDGRFRLTPEYVFTTVTLTASQGSAVPFGTPSVVRVT